MTPKAWTIIGIVVFMFLAVIVGVPLYVMGIYNHEIALHNRFDAQENVIETTHDTMWKTIKQKYEIKGDYEQTFKEGLKAVAVGRQGGSLFKSSSESSSQLGLSTDVYRDMMNTIEGKREGLKRSQDMLTDLWQTHKTYCEQVPNRFFIGDKIFTKPAMISSTSTKNVIATKLDDDISLGKPAAAEKE